jgi:endonuclease III-like uncharacterized protein
MSKLYKLLKRYYGRKSPWLEVEEVLEAEEESKEKDDFYDPFKNLIIGILSQNTSDRNSTSAYINLKRNSKSNQKNWPRRKKAKFQRQ